MATESAENQPLQEETPKKEAPKKETPKRKTAKKKVARKATKKEAPRKKAVKRKKAKKATKRKAKRAVGKPISKHDQNVAHAVKLLRANPSIKNPDIRKNGQKAGYKISPNQMAEARKRIGKKGKRRGRAKPRSTGGTVDSHLQDAVIEAIRSAQYQQAKNILGVLEKS